MTSKIMTFPILTEEVKEWSLRNFGDKQNPMFGMVEEVGELAHCLLKRFQGIRGFESYVFFQDHYLDAIGDIGVYSANFAYANELVIEWPVALAYDSETWTTSHNKHLSSACYWLSHLGLGTLSTGENHRALELWLGKFLLQIDCLAKLESLTLPMATTLVWKKVKERDWTKNKTNGLC